MGYGVVIGMSHGIKLLEAYGRLYDQATSHRAESTGGLAAAVILYHLQRYTALSIPSTCKVNIMIDSQGLIKRLCDRRQYINVYANATLAADWDMVEEIHQTYTAMQLTNYQYEWVKSHQQDQPEKRISQAEKFNVQADRLARTSPPKHGLHLKKGVDLKRHTKCNFYIDDVAQHGHYTAAIRKASAKTEYLNYLQARHGWDKYTIDDIDWDIMYTASRQYKGTSISLLKLVHNKMPTNLQKSKYNKGVSPLCHFCTHPDTFDHLCTSQCNPRSQTFQQDLEKSLTHTMRKAALPKQFITTFTLAIRLWYESSTGNEPSQWKGPQSVRNHQDRIGWPQMFRGFVSRSWRHYLQRALREEVLEEWCTNNNMGDMDNIREVRNERAFRSNSLSRHPIDITKTLAQCICMVWQAMGKLWMEHTGFIHQTNDHQSPIKTQELKNQIRVMQQLKNKALAAHRDRYFFQDVEIYLEKATTIQMSRYVERYKPAILNSIKQAQRIATQSRLIPQFFGHKESNPKQNCASTLDNEEPPHRKHTKIRNFINQSITSFFPKLKPPP